MGETVVGAPRENAAQRSVPPKKDGGACSAVAVLGAESAPLPSPCRPLSHQHLTHRLQESEGIASSLHLGRCHKGPWAHQEFVLVAAGMGSAPSVPEPPTPTPSSTGTLRPWSPRFIEAGFFLCLIMTPGLPRMRGIMTEGSGPGVRCRVESYS